MPLSANRVEARSEPPVRLENELCARFRCTMSQCSACLEVCPVPGAIRPADERGVEITDACVACGACASACPNGAIQAADSDRLLAERIRSRTRPKAAFRIACERAKGRADLILPCLGRLTEALVLEPIRCGAEHVELLDPGCSGCQFEKAAAQWESVLELSRALFESAGFDAACIVRTDAPRRKREQPRVSLNAPGSRRAMFRAIAARWKAAAEAGPDAGPEQAPKEQFRDIVRRHPENPKRSHLLEVLRTLRGAEVRSKVVSAAGKPLAQLEITAQCVGCDVCETLCPVGALRHHEENGTYTLDFEPALCTGCHVCEAACYHKAVRVREAFDLSVLFEGESVTLLRATRRTCRVCHETYLDTLSEFCPLCRINEQRREMIARRFLFAGGSRDRV